MRGRAGAKQAAATCLSLFVSRRRGIACPPSRDALMRELSLIMQQRKDALARKQIVERELCELKSELINVETERSGLHFKSYTLFSENTTFAIRLSALRSPYPGTAAEGINEREHDRILDRYVFRTDRCGVSGKSSK